MQKKIPMRQCLGCREMKPKATLVRVVRSPEGEIALDTKGKASGRGAYVCHDAECLAMARKAKRFEKAFSCAIPDDVFERMEDELKNDR